jgi:hypothetical protein
MVGGVNRQLVTPQVARSDPLDAIGRPSYLCQSCCSWPSAFPLRVGIMRPLTTCDSVTKQSPVRIDSVDPW